MMNYVEPSVEKLVLKTETITASGDTITGDMGTTTSADVETD